MPMSGNGRWLMLDARYSGGPLPLPSPLLMTPEVGEIGFTIFLITDVPSPTPALLFTRPSGTSFTVSSPSTYSTKLNGFPLPPNAIAIVYVSESRVFNEGGEWGVSALSQNVLKSLRIKFIVIGGFLPAPDLFTLNVSTLDGTFVLG